jgi:hypothetical protein
VLTAEKLSATFGARLRLARTARRLRLDLSVP